MEDIDFLPADLKEKSLSERDIILPFEEALKAIHFFKENEWTIVWWEGWIKYSIGKHGPSNKKRESFFKINKESWSSFVNRSAVKSIEGIKRAKNEWDIHPEYPGAELYFCIYAKNEDASTIDYVIYDDDEVYFYYSATLRIFGEIPSIEEITRTLGLTPSHTHNKGEIQVKSRPDKLWEHDMWSYKVPINEEESLDVHIQTLWNKIKPFKQYLLKLKERVKVDVFLGYRSNSGTAGFMISPESLEMFVELDIPFEVSVIVT